ncbi:ribokinase-like isoform X2 [Epargyreus clarus]
MICRLGDDHWGKQYKDYFREIGVNVTYGTITQGVSTGIAQILVAESGENQIVFVAGANNHLSISDVHKAEDVIKNADIVIAQLETPFETSLEAFKIARGIRLFNAAPARKDISEILPYCTILCVNESEASLLVDFSVDTSNMVKALEALLATGCETVIITLGENGAAYISKNEKDPIHVLCDSVIPVDTTGAGDAFVGALATFLVTKRNFPLHQIVGAACDIATMSVTKEGTQTSYPSEHTAFNKVYKYVTLK